MKTILTLSLMITLLSFISCGKAVDIKGLVLSKHKIPVPNAVIRLQMFKGSDYPENDFEAGKTDRQGTYTIHTRFRNQRTYKVSCVCDSGQARSLYLNGSGEKDVDLLLQ